MTIGRRERSNDVDVDVGRSGGGNLERGVTVDFAALTLYTCSGPLSYIAVDVGPNVPFRDQTLCCLDTWMGKVVEGVENGAAE